MSDRDRPATDIGDVLRSISGGLTAGPGRAGLTPPPSVGKAGGIGPKGSTSFSPEAWVAEYDPVIRFQIYAAIALNIIADADSVSDDDLRLLSYGIFRDQKMWKSVEPALVREDMQAELVGTLPGRDPDTPVQDARELLNYDLLASALVERWDDPGAAELLGSLDRIEPEALQVPATVALLAPALGAGIAAAGGYSAGAATGLNGVAMYFQQGVLTQPIKMRVLALASQLANKMPSATLRGLSTWQRWALGSTAALGTGITAWDVANAYLNPDEYGPDAVQQADAMAVSIAEVARNSDPQFWQQASEAATAYSQGRVPFAPLATSAELARAGLALPFDEEAFGSYIPGEGPPDPRNVDPNLDNPYIGGYSEDYRATRPLLDTELDDKGFRRYLRSGDESQARWQQVAPMYRANDFETLWGNMTPSKLIQMQMQMIDAGLIDPDAKVGGTAFRAGSRDIHTRNAFMNLLDVANGEGLSWEDTLLKLAIEGRLNQETPQREPFLRSAYLAPDPAEIKNAAISAVESTLGRKINDWELALLSQGFAADSRTAFDATEAARYQEWLAEGRALELMDAGELVTETDPGSVQGVNPSARFEQRFRDLFQNEIDRRSEVERVSDLVPDLMNGLSTGLRAFGS